MPVNEPLLHNWFYGNYGVRVAASVVFAYLLASIPVAAVIGWLFAGLSARMARLAYAAVPLVDAAKCFVATVIPLHGGGETIGLFAGFAATIGHYYTPWRSFRGDWRIGSFVGVLAALNAPAACAAIVFWIVASYGAGSPAIGTLFAAAIAFWPLWFCAGPLAALFGIAAGTALGLRVSGRQVFERFDVENLDRAAAPAGDQSLFL